MMSRRTHIILSVVSGILFVYAIYLHVEVLLGEGLSHSLYGANLFGVGFLIAFTPFIIEIWRNRHLNTKPVAWARTQYNDKWLQKVFNIVFSYYAILFFVSLYLGLDGEVLGVSINAASMSAGNMTFLLASVMIHRVIVNYIKTTSQVND